MIPQVGAKRNIPICCSLLLLLVVVAACFSLLVGGLDDAWIHGDTHPWEWRRLVYGNGYILERYLARLGAISPLQRACIASVEGWMVSNGNDQDGWWHLRTRSR